jgi:hypothetical protein
LEGAVEILRRHSNDDDPVPLNELGQPFESWYGSGRRNFLSQRLLVFMHENQGVYNWAIKLNGADDPPVVVEVDSAPKEVWQPSARTFSEFVYYQVWDYSLKGSSCSAHEPALDPSTLEYLRRSYREEPQTHGGPGNAYRFSAPSGRVLIWHGESHGADWRLLAATGAQLEELLRSVWTQGSLARTLRGDDPAAEQAILKLRKG